MPLQHSLQHRLQQTVQDTQPLLPDACRSSWDAQHWPTAASQQAVDQHPALTTAHTHQANQQPHQLYGWCSVQPHAAAQHCLQPGISQLAAQPIPCPQQHQLPHAAVQQPNRWPSSDGSYGPAMGCNSSDLCSSFGGLSLGSSCARLSSAQNHLDRQDTRSTDTLSVRSTSCHYPPLPVSGQQGLQHYPSLDSSTPSSRQPSGIGIGSLQQRTFSSCSTGSGRYPAVPGVDGNTSTPCITPGLCAAPQPWPNSPAQPLSPALAKTPVQQQQQQPPSPSRSWQHLHREQHQQRAAQSGLYPVLSGQECTAQYGEQQQQQQDRVDQLLQQLYSCNSQQHQHSAAAVPQQQLSVTHWRQQQQSPAVQHVPKVQWGYDLEVQLLAVNGLAAAGDPFVIVRVHLDGHDEQFRTEPQWGTQEALYGQEDVFQLGNMAAGCVLCFEVWDKNWTSGDSMMGRAAWQLALGPCEPSTVAAPATADCSGRDIGNRSQAAANRDTANRDQAPLWPAAATVTLELTHPTRDRKAGKLCFQVRWRPSAGEGRPRMLGPVRFRQHLCRTAALLTGHCFTEQDMAYLTYKLFLCHISSVFEGVRMPWNRDYSKGRMLFESPVLLAGVQAQHRAMYATQTGPTRGGTLRTAADFFHLFNNGMRGGERRYFTYSLCADSFRCSETGAAFFNDMLSKHAMHSNGAEEVLYAGEFCIVPCAGAPGGHKLVIDNNSGTYAPHKCKLHLMKRLFILNFLDMHVDVLDWRDDMLEHYHFLCPSRAAGAAAASRAPCSAASQPVGALTPRGSKQQFVAG